MTKRYPGFWRLCCGVLDEIDDYCRLLRARRQCIQAGHWPRPDVTRPTKCGLCGLDA